jgi:predicted transcriptional regulator
MVFRMRAASTGGKGALGAAPAVARGGGLAGAQSLSSGPYSRDPLAFPIVRFHGIVISTSSVSGIILTNMNIIRRTLDIDADTDARLHEMSTERGQDVSAVLAEAVALLDSLVDIAGPDIAEDRRRLDDFKTTQIAVPLDDVKTWVASWGSADERPRPAPRKIG